MTYALELKALRKSFGKTDISVGRPGGRSWRKRGDHRAQRRRQVHVVQPDQRPAHPTSGAVLLNGQRIDGKTPFEVNRLGLSRSFQITNIFPKLSVFENLRCGLLWSMGYR